MIKSALPTLGQLHKLVDSVSDYPVSARQIVEIAKNQGADPKVVDFYKSFPGDIEFEDSEDLTDRSEQVEFLKEEGIDQPPEVVRSPQT